MKWLEYFDHRDTDYDDEDQVCYVAEYAHVGSKIHYIWVEKNIYKYTQELGKWSITVSEEDEGVENSFQEKNVVREVAQEFVQSVSKINIFRSAILEVFTR